MKPTLLRRQKGRRGIIAVLAAALFVVTLAMIAFAVDIGYVAMVKTQLQVAADSAALAAAGSSNKTPDDMKSVAKRFAGYHLAGSSKAVVNDSDVVFGTWDITQPAGHEFSGTSSSILGTALKVTTHANGIPLFFGRIFGAGTKDMTASATAAVNPRDIVFVVDLSNSMSNDSNPDQGGTTSFIQAVYNDLFGVTGAGAPRVTYDSAETVLKSNTSGTITITAAMDWLNQKFPYINPTPNTSDPASVGYWTAALNSNESYHGSPFVNAKSGSTVTSYKMSYKSYVTFLMYRDRNQEMGTVGGTKYYTIMSVLNPNYKKHSETVNNVTYDNFPPPEMPTHAVRRAIITALQVIQTRNNTVGEAEYKDKVSIVVFDRKGSGNTLIRQELTAEYADAIQSAKTLQACYYGDECTDSDGGLIVAGKHLLPHNATTNPLGKGRENSNKVVVFLTDGLPNLYESSTTDISNAKKTHSSGWGSSTAQDGALLQALNMQGKNWSLYAVGVGVNGSQSFMDLMAGMAQTQIPKVDVNGKETKGAYDIAKDVNTYETTLKDIFNRIISNPKLRLVQ
jgi:hypothetical protein